MKKIFIILSVLSQSLYAQIADIEQIIVSPIDINTINVYTNTNLSEYSDGVSDSYYEINSNEIGLFICYYRSPLPTHINIEHNNQIDVSGLSGNYDLIVRVYFDMPPCYGEIKDTETLNLTLPLDGNVGLLDGDILSEKTILLYPNPVTNILYIDNKSISSIESVQVYDVLGKLVAQELNNLGQIDVSSLKSGVYLVKIETDRGVISKKVIKI